MADTLLEQLELRRLQRVDRPPEAPASPPPTQTPGQGSLLQELQARKSRASAQQQPQAQPQEQGLSAKDYGIGQALNRIDALTLGGGARLYGNVGAAYSSLVDGKDFDTEFEAQRAEAQGYLRNYRDANPVMSTVESMAGGGLSGYNVGGAVAAGARALPGAAGRVLGGALTYSGRPGVTGNLVRGAQNVGAGAAFAAGEAINRGSDDVSTETALGAALGPAGAAAGRLAAETIGKASRALGDIFAPNGEFSKEAADFIRAEGIDPKTIHPATAKHLMEEFERVGNDAARQEAVITDFAAKMQKALADKLKNVDQQGIEALRESKDISQEEYRFGVVLSDAQRRQDESALRRDEAIRNEVYGPQSAKLINQRDATQNAQVQAGLDRFGEEISGRERGILQNAEQLGETVAFLREKTHEQASARYSSAQDAAGGARISADDVEGQVNRVRATFQRKYGRNISSQANEILADYDRLISGVRPASPSTMSDSALGKSLKGEADPGRKKELLDAAIGRGDDAVIDIAEQVTGRRWKNPKIAQASLERFVGPIDDSVVKRPSGSVNFRSLNDIRKRINEMRSGTGYGTPERNQLDTLRQSLDREMDAAFENGLFKGDLGAIGELKDARKVWRDYKSRFFAQKGGEFRDGAGMIIQKMGAREAEPLEIVNSVLGAAKVGAKSDGVKAIRRLKGMLTPEEFGLIQRMAWDKATKGFDAENVAVSRRGGLTPQKIAANIENFTSSDAKGSWLAKEIFNEEQLQDMRRFAALLRKIPYENQYNPSKSGYTGARLGRQALEALVAGGIGTVLGGPGGGVVSAAGAAALRQGISNYTDAVTVRQVASTWKDAQVDDTLRDARLDWAAIVGRNAAVFGGTGQEE